MSKNLPELLEKFKKDQADRLTAAHHALLTKIGATGNPVASVVPTNRFDGTETGLLYQLRAIAIRLESLKSQVAAAEAEERAAWTQLQSLISERETPKVTPEVVYQELHSRASRREPKPHKETAQERLDRIIEEVGL